MNKQEGVIEQAWRIVRRRKWVVLQALIAVPVLAFLFTMTQPKEYTATATLLFRSPPAALEESSGVVDPTREAATNGELVALPVIAEEAAKTLSEEDLAAGDIFGSISVAPSENADTAAVSSTTEDPDLSASLCQRLRHRLHRASAAAPTVPRSRTRSTSPNRVSKS